MKRAELVALRLGLLLVVAGCWSEYQVGSLPKPAAKPAASPAAQASQPATPAMPPLAFPSAPAGPHSIPPRGAMPASASPPLPPTMPLSPAGLPRASSVPSMPPAAQQFPIDLSVGVALPQTLPEGTAMGFSVTYRFGEGEPHPSIQYAWVITKSQQWPVTGPGSPQGPSSSRLPSKRLQARIPVRLDREGTLYTFIQGWRPEEEPFQTHIEDSRGQRLSEIEPLHVTGGS